MKTNIIIKKSDKADKKFVAIIDDKKKVYFGGAGYEDYTTHKDPTRKERYIGRHQSRENWTADGYETAGWYSRWVLWNLPSLRDSIANINSRFKNINIKLDI